MTEDPYYSSQEFQELLRRYEQAQEEGTSLYMDPDEMADIAEYYNQLGHADKAIRMLDYADSLFPGAAPTVSLRARMALVDEHDAAKAREMASRITDTTHIEYHYLMAEILLFEQKADEADRYLNEVYASLFDDEQEDFVIDCASLFTDYGCYDQASRWLALSTDYDASDYKELKGRLAMYHGNYDESERIFNELLDSNPYSSPYWNHLASLEFMRNNIRDSIANSEFSIAINPNDEEAILNKANGLYSLGNYEEAGKFYQRYAELCPTDETGELFQGICDVNLGNMQSGIFHLHMAEALLPSDSPALLEIWQELAFAYSRVDLFDAALEYADKMVEVCQQLPPDATLPANMMPGEALVVRAHLLMEMGRYSEGHQCYAKALETSDHSPHIYLRIAISIYDLGFYRQSYKLFRLLRESQRPGCDEGYAYEALCCHALQKQQEFCEAVRLACEKNPVEAQQVLAELFPEGMEAKDFYAYLNKKN